MFAYASFNQSPLIWFVSRQLQCRCGQPPSVLGRKWSLPGKQAVLLILVNLVCAGGCLCGVWGWVSLCGCHCVGVCAGVLWALEIKTMVKYLLLACRVWPICGLEEISEFLLRTSTTTKILSNIMSPMIILMSMDFPPLQNCWFGILFSLQPGCKARFKFSAAFMDYKRRQS